MPISNITAKEVYFANDGILYKDIIYYCFSVWYSHLEIEKRYMDMILKIGIIVASITSIFLEFYYTK